MVAGGARARSGPPPDPNALRRNRPSDPGYITLPATCDLKAPRWPLTKATPREMQIWRKLWKRPQASQWHVLQLEDEVALYCRYLAEAEQPNATTSIRSEARQYQDMLGLSTAGLARLRWKIGPDGATAATAAIPSGSASTDEMRTRLRALNGGSSAS